MSLLDEHIALHKRAAENGALICETCAGIIAFPHDHRPDETGLDDGPWMPGRAPRKKAPQKPAEETREIRTRAWATLRVKYGRHGHK